MLDDVAPQPAVADPSPAGGLAGGETATVVLTLEQEGAATRARARAARLQAAAAAQDAGDAQRQSGQVLPGAAAPGAGAVVRTGLGVGHGVFDVAYKPPAADAPFVRFGRGYSDRERWSEKEAQGWQADLTKSADGWGAMNRTVRLFKVIWQGQELSREAVVKVLVQALGPVGLVVSDLAVCSEMFESKGVRANGGEKVLGSGGGMYVPLLMHDLQQGSTMSNRSAEEEAQLLELWGGVRPDGSEEIGPGQGIEFWDCPAGYFTVGVPMLMADRREVVHNLCVQMSWQTLESVEEPEKLGYLAGDWFVEGCGCQEERGAAGVQGNGCTEHRHQAGTEARVGGWGEAADDLWAGASGEEDGDPAGNQAAETGGDD